jgi:hypothetical protein
MLNRIRLRDHVISPQHGLDRVKLSIQKSVLGSFDRPNAERIALLWNMTRHLTVEEIIQCFGEPLDSDEPIFIHYRDWSAACCSGHYALCGEPVFGEGSVSVTEKKKAVTCEKCLEKFDSQTLTSKGE